jgi:hypothetical protein
VKESSPVPTPASASFAFIAAAGPDNVAAVSSTSGAKTMKMNLRIKTSCL